MFKSEGAVPDLTVLYDSSCGFCVSCRRWIEHQPAYVSLRFIASQSARAASLFPELTQGDAREELVVVTDEGDVYRGASAWIMCLWALQEYREWALRLSAPALLPFARQAFELLSRNRKGISCRLGLLLEPELFEKLRGAAAPTCSTANSPARS